MPIYSPAVLRYAYVFHISTELNFLELLSMFHTTRHRAIQATGSLVQPRCFNLPLSAFYPRPCLHFFLTQSSCLLKLLSLSHFLQLFAQNQSWHSEQIRRLSVMHLWGRGGGAQGGAADWFRLAEATKQFYKQGFVDEAAYALQAQLGINNVLQD